MGHPQALLEEPAQGADRQRSDGDPFLALGRQGRFDLGSREPGGEPVRAASTSATGSERIRRAAKARAPDGRRVAPLDVVDRDDERTVGGQGRG